MNRGTGTGLIAFGVEGRNMLAALGGGGIVGIAVVVLIVLAVIYFARRT